MGGEGRGERGTTCLKLAIGTLPGAGYNYTSQTQTNHHICTIALSFLFIGSSDRTTDAFIGGAMVGVAGAILLCLFFFVCTCTICLCKRGGNCCKRTMPAVPVNAKRYSKINGNNIDVPQEN